MHIVLVGPGALGSLLASRLSHGNSAGKHHLTLLDHNAERARLLASRGIRYTYKDTTREIHLATSSSPESTGVADVVLLCVKSYDVSRGLDFCSPLLGPDTLLIFMQNGVAHLEVPVLSNQGTPAYGTTTEGANLKGPGHVLHAGKGLTQFGFLKPVDIQAREKLVAMTALFNESDLKARIADDILSRLWTKLMVNAGINGLTAVLNCPNGDLLTHPEGSQRMELLVDEAMRVAATAGIHVPTDSLQITRDVCAKTAANISSMLQDVRTGRRTEIDAINGAVVAVAQKHGLDCPANAQIVAQVKQLEKSYLRR